MSLRQRQDVRALMGAAALICSVLLYSGAVAQAQGEELCPNGGLEDDVTGWNFVAGGYGLTAADWAQAGNRATISDREKHSGKAGLILDASNHTDEVDLYSVPIAVRAGYGYRLGSFVRWLGKGVGYKVTVDWRTGEGKHLRYDNDWKGSGKPEEFTAHGGVFVPPPGTAQAVIILGVQKGASYAFDDISLRELGPAAPLDARPRRDGDGSVGIIGPTSVAAGSAATWRVTYTAGTSGLPSGGAIVIARSNVNFEWPAFQTTDAARPAYVSVRGPRGAIFSISGGRELTVTLDWPALQPGEQVDVTLGDTSGGSLGLPVQSRPEQGIEWVVSSDTNADGKFAPVARGGRFDVTPGPAAEAVVVAPATTEVGRETKLTVEVRDKVGSVTSDFTGALQVTTDDAGARLDGRCEMRAGEAAKKTLTCAFATAGTRAVSLRTPAGLRATGTSVVVSVSSEPALVVADGIPRCRAEGPYALLSNDRLCAVFPRNASGYGYAALYARAGEGWRQVAALASFGKLLWPGAEGKPVEQPLWAASVREGSETRERSGLVFTGSARDPQGMEWPLTVRMALGPHESHLEASFELQPTSQASLLAFYGPVVQAGEGSFGSTKRGALFPGLEYLAADEVSSDDKGVAWDIRERWVPHPYKITVPLMAVAGEDATVALMWDPLQRWDGEHAVPLARFASPDRPGNRDSHLMALFAPYLPGEFTENLPHATKPWAPPRGGRLSLRGQVVILPRQPDVTAAVRYWTVANSLPQLRLIRPWKDELALCGKGQTETAWNVDKRGWISAVGWAPAPSMQVADQLLQSASLVEDAALAGRMRAQAEEVIGAHGVGGTELSLRRGSAAAAVNALRAGAYGNMAGQHPEGFWTFSQVYSMEGNKATLARPEDVELGTCVNRLQPILRYAVMTGDPEAEKAGLLGLEYIRRFTKPAGSESWEVPLVNPNLRAAALACECCVDGYLITGDKEYLERARYWAWAGLAFIYLWEAPDRPAMPGASISVMGTTFHTHPWFGSAVQWVGLAYAQALQYLAECDSSYRWRDVAALITASAMRQQKTEEAPCKHLGFYPDSYSVVKGEDYYEWCLAPTGITANVLSLMGRDAGVRTVVVPNTMPLVRVTTPAKAIWPGYDAEQRELSVSLVYHAGETAQVVVFGASPPEAVEWQGRALLRVDDLAPTQEGWLVPPREQYVVLKLRWTEESGTLALRGTEPTPYRAPEVPGRTLNGGFEEGKLAWRCDPETVISRDAVRSGTMALLIPSADLDHEVQANSEMMRVEAGRQYRLSAWVRQLKGMGDYKVTIDWLDAGQRHLSYANDWAERNRPQEFTEHGGTFQAPPGAAFARLILGTRRADCVFDDLELAPIP